MVSSREFVTEAVTRFLRQRPWLDFHTQSMPLHVIESSRQKHLGLYVLSKWTPAIFAVRLCQAFRVAGYGNLVDARQVSDTLTIVTTL